MSYIKKQVTQEDIDKQLHRKLIGGMWNEIGKLQFDILRQEGLDKNNTLLDIGCGCLRGGVHFIKYLDSDCYYGVESNVSLINAGIIETEKLDIRNKNFYLRFSDCFDFNAMKIKRFDYILAYSLFTHLDMNNIITCLYNAQHVMHGKSKFFATFFIVKDISIYPEKICGVNTYYRQDPYHYRVKEIRAMARLVGLKVKLTKHTHPKGQTMFMFTK